ncbi:MAG: BON domain-containing protein [Cryobacterium sp.]|nr:BON domain-containing protein [Oligoflexia bacterium]
MKEKILEKTSPTEDLRDQFEAGFESKSFTSNFKQYSQDFQDNDTSAPGIDNDYATTDGNTQQWIGLRALDRSDSPGETIPTPSPVGESRRAHTPMDDRLREGVYAALTDEAANYAGDVEVEVLGGVVELSGTVPEEEMRAKIENLALGIPGVENVKNLLTTRRGVARGAPETRA